MTWEIRPAGDAFPSFATDWDHLNGQLYGGHPAFDSRFVGALLTHFGNGSESLCIHRSGEAVDGALILCARGFGRWALFLPAQAPAGALLIADASCLETLMPALPGYAWTIDLLAIDPAFEPDWSPLLLPRTVVRHQLTMAVATGGDFPAYWQARPGKLRSNLRRYQRRSDDHAASVRVIAEPQEIGAAVSRYAAVESAGWKAVGGTAIGSDNPQGLFYEQLLCDFAASGQARIVELWFDDRLAASRLVVCHQRMWIMLKTTYDESLAAMAPGRQLLYEALQLAFADMPAGAVEFYTNATRDQAEWATHLRHVCHHQLYRNTTVANFHGIARALRCRFAGGETAEDSLAFDATSVAAYHSPAAMPPAMRSLFEAAAGREVELSPDWFANLQAAVFGDDDSVRYYGAELYGSPTAILPVHASRRSGRRAAEIEALANFYTALYAPLASPGADPTDLGRLLQAARADCARARVMNFHPMAVDSPVYEAMVVALRSTGWIPFRYFCFGNWYLEVDGSWSAYLEQRDGILRHTLRRKRRRFLAAGGSFEIVTGTAALEPAIAEFNALYRQRWKKSEPYAAFVPGLMRWLAASGKLRLGIARLAGEAVAAQLWIVSGDKASIYKMAYDEAHSSHAPGTLLTAHLMEQVIDVDRVSEVDYLIGDDPYKQAWMSHRRERWGIVAYRADRFAGIARLLLEIIGRVIRRTPARIVGKQGRFSVRPTQR
ncbi:MAG: Protein involved in cellulose biosynthesis (CelD) [Candidatus Accumulibacter adjunctus]|mgnify:FL=1|uniref:Protein involved in cellulose biosynthesis (CelD) n=1 Tax=Candidatus Accumulibacter adjunctus TaxID=1454001 RepID=A0A011PFP9_9PROT|nr:MAG: Protein involved in cellulose biosynthesis (CelD) [Candidatus Accumulibacter adjunctus]